MMKKFTSKELKDIDRRAQQEYAIPGIVLMENAGIRAGDIALKMLRSKKNKKVLIFCGPGNNGGDGFVIARHLINNNIKANVVLLSDPCRISGDALVNYNILLKMGANISVLGRYIDAQRLTHALKNSGLVIDAIFGIGLDKAVSGIFMTAVELINNCALPVLSIDVPSGLCADTGKPLGVCVRAHTTVTFGAAKKGFYRREGKKYTGHVIIADISLPRKLLE